MSVTTEPVESPLSTTPYQSSAGHDSEVQEYRSVCKAAVTSVAFAVLGLSAFMSELLVLVPLVGVAFGIISLNNIRRYPEELVGKIPARIGLVVSAALFVGSIATHAFIYATEVPPDYQRISFGQLTPNRRTSLPYSEKAELYDGKKVFIRGYVRPPSGKQKKLKQFIMVGDFGDCCFGGSPAITDVISVKIKSDDTVDYGYGLRRIGGVFRLNPRTTFASEKEVPRVFYEIEADYVR